MRKLRTAEIAGLPPAAGHTAMKTDRSFWMVRLLSLVTCGIYGFFFYYGALRDINKICEGDGRDMPESVFLLSLLSFGIYGIFWDYWLGNRMQLNASRYGLHFEESGTTILTWDLLGNFTCSVGNWYACYLLCRNLNSLSAAYNEANGLTE